MSNINTIKYLTQDELKRLFQVIATQNPKKRSPNPVYYHKRNLAIFLIAYRHGLRAGEIGMLEVEDIDLTQGRIRIRREKHSTGGEYTMQPDEIRILKAWLKERRGNNLFLFPSQRGTPISRRTLDYLMKQYGVKANIPPDKRHFHVLKHSICTHLSEAETDLRFIQDWVGHANIQSTVVYTHITNPKRDKQARKVFASPSIVSP